MSNGHGSEDVVLAGFVRDWIWFIAQFYFLSEKDLKKANQMFSTNVLSSGI